MKVVGIDPSLTGCAIWTSDGGAGEFKSDTSFGADVRGRWDRYAAICSGLEGVIDDGTTDLQALFVVEGNQGRIMGAGINLIEFSWHLKAWLADCYPVSRIIEVPPTSLKQWVAGKGNADKVAVASALTKRYGEEFATNNQADAFGLLKFGEGLLGRIETTKAQRAIYEKLKL
jgi:hypothetical protein